MARDFAAGSTGALATASWTSRVVDRLPGEPRLDARPRGVVGAAWSPIHPTPVAAPTLLGWSADLADSLGLPTEPTGAMADDLAQVLAGNALVEGMAPYAARYGGHQFGNWAGQLGDGRAIALGEIVDRRGVSQTLQLKGAGPTPYSRRADGRAVLRSSVREFLCSEAMHHLGIPTTRALSLVGTGDAVVRDMFYDGRPEAEPGAIVCRVSPGFLRFGSFELPAFHQEPDLLAELVAFTLDEHYPELRGDPGGPVGSDAVVALFDEVARRTLRLVLDWTRVGFVHGVMNTDNLSILGETIDYGPYGWLEDFDPSWTPNTTDRHEARYRYGAQVGIGQWNLSRLGSALATLVSDPSPLQATLDGYGRHAETGWFSMWATKLGLTPPVDGRWVDDSVDGRVDGPVDGAVDAADRSLIEDLFGVLTSTETDLTIFVRRLPDVADLGGALGDRALVEPLLDAYYRPDELTGDVLAGIAGWLRRWRDRVSGETVRPGMDAVNPRYVLRNYLAQLVVDAAATGDTAPMASLAAVLRTPYADQPGAEEYEARRPEWARTRPGCSMLSCSS